MGAIRLLAVCCIAVPAWAGDASPPWGGSAPRIEAGEPRWGRPAGSGDPWGTGSSGLGDSGRVYPGDRGDRRGIVIQGGDPYRERGDSYGRSWQDPSRDRRHGWRRHGPESWNGIRRDRRGNYIDREEYRDRGPYRVEDGGREDRSYGRGGRSGWDREDRRERWRDR